MLSNITALPSIMVQNGQLVVPASMSNWGVDTVRYRNVIHSRLHSPDWVTGVCLQSNFLGLLELGAFLLVQCSTPEGPELEEATEVVEVENSAFMMFAAEPHVAPAPAISVLPAFYQDHFVVIQREVSRASFHDDDVESVLGPQPDWPAHIAGNSIIATRGSERDMWQFRAWEAHLRRAEKLS